MVNYLFCGDLDRFLEEDPSDRLGAGRCGEGAGVGPVGGARGQQPRRVQRVRHRHLVALVSDKRQETHHFF